MILLSFLRTLSALAVSRIDFYSLAKRNFLSRNQIWPYCACISREFFLHFTEKKRSWNHVASRTKKYASGITIATIAQKRIKLHKYTCLLCVKSSNIFQDLYLCFEGMQPNPKGVRASCLWLKAFRKLSKLYSKFSQIFFMKMS